MRQLLAVAQLTAALAELVRLERGRTRRPPLAPGAEPPAEAVSVVVPARDEAERIGPCLDGLLADPHVAEVVVVDDCSTDGTANVARAYGARVVRGGELPAGWVGKPWALQQGLEGRVRRDRGQPRRRHAPAARLGGGAGRGARRGRPRQRGLPLRLRPRRGSAGCTRRCSPRWSTGSGRRTRSRAPRPAG